ncbi:oxidoreductase [Caldalkalibacillus thermarum]|uniref:NAD(P)/FAD-dependent oxidoreductase n=1 Tax=Caldalkalibacillus thermarum TaxID=296745 RepID=UPI001666285D|nr:FAD-dependent oxidoreductase [Caldalkalibacillus thermarum]GGK23754.1 oxidoreductase [Caldalkalibacillus thermarum]
MQTCIVVGGGILGASTAYHLAKAGAKVTLVDRQDPGQATDAAAGILCPWVTQRRNKAWYRLAKNGARHYPALIKELEEEGITDTGYARVGTICLHTDEEKLDKIEERAYKRRQDAPEIGEITRLSPKETKDLFPPLKEQYSAVHISGGARVNGRALREALVYVAKRYGASFLYGDATLVAEDNHVIGIKVNGEKLYADQVIVTTGAWAKALLQPLGVRLQVAPQRAQIVHLELPDTDTSKWPVVMPPANKYILSFEGGRVVIGATHEDNVGFDARVTAGGLHEILNKALEIAPGLANGTVLETRVGFRPLTPGFLPVVGPLPGYKGVLIANGLGSSGLTVGPYLGAELAKLALGREMEIDITDYDVCSALENH